MRLGLNMKAAPVINQGGRFQMQYLKTAMTAARGSTAAFKQSSLDVICADYWEEQRLQEELSLSSPICHWNE